MDQALDKVYLHIIPQPAAYNQSQALKSVRYMTNYNF